MPAQRPRPTVLASLLLSTLLVAGLILASPADAGTGADEQRFVQLINQTRASAGLPPLTVHAELRSQARSWASSMATTDRLAHAPDISRGISAPWTVLGENVGVHGVHDIGQLHRAFVASPSHYANIVDARYTHVGVGVVITDEGTLWTTHRFMAVAETPPTTTPPTTTRPSTTPPTSPAPTTASPTTATTTTRSAPTTVSPTTATTTTRPAPTSVSPATTPPATRPVSTTRPAPTADRSGSTPDRPAAVSTPDSSTPRSGGAPTPTEEQAPAPIGGDTNGQRPPDQGDIELVSVGPGPPDVDTVEQVLIDLIEAGF